MQQHGCLALSANAAWLPPALALSQLHMQCAAYVLIVLFNSAAQSLALSLCIYVCVCVDVCLFACAFAICRRRRHHRRGIVRCLLPLQRLKRPPTGL